MSAAISPHELEKKFDQKSAFLLVEALSPDQLRQGHLPGAINLPPDQLKELAPNLLPDKRQQIVVSFASSTCQGSENAARELVGMNFRNVRRYFGGKKDWTETGSSLVGKEPAA